MHSANGPGQTVWMQLKHAGCEARLPQLGWHAGPQLPASLADMRSTLSAMQRGWQQGRSQTPRETEDSAADGE